MKKYFALFLAIGLIACNADDDSGESALNTTDYFPTSANATWTYNNTGDTGDSQDTMSVAGTEETNGHTYTNLDTEAMANGFMVGILTDNLIRRDGGQLLINGTLGAPVEGFPEISIPLDDVILYDANADEGDTLSTLTDVIEQTVMEIPLTISYTSTSIQGESLPTFTAGETSYTDVIRSRIVLNLSVSTSIMIGDNTLVVPILSSQNVLVVENYYAADTGLIRSKTTIDYELNDLPTGVDFELPLPESDTQVSTATLASFNIGD